MKHEDSVFTVLSFVFFSLVVLFFIALLQQCGVATEYNPTTVALESVPVVVQEEDVLEEPLEGIQDQDMLQPMESVCELVDVPLAPVEQAPFVEELEVEDPVEDVVSEYVDPYGGIDWSQFVFSDEAVQLPDGIYYSNVYINDVLEGVVETYMEGGVPLFSRMDLAALLSPLLTTDCFDGVFSHDGDMSFEYLLAHSQNARFDQTNLELFLDFSSDSIPVRTISIRGDSSRAKVKTYDVMGSVELEPAFFSFVSNLNLTANIQHDRDFNIGSYGVSLSLSNTFSMYNATMNLPLSMSFDKWSGFTLSVGNLYGYMDFPDESLRLSFGGVGSYSFGSGRPLGVSIEKNYAFGTQSSMLHQYTQTIELEEDSSVEVLMNGRSVYRKNHGFGVYLLRDFVFSQGDNDVTVVVHPLSMGDDTSLDKVLVFNQSYDTSLLSKGDDTWRLGMAVPIETNASGLGILWEHSIGLSHIYTQSHHLSISMRIVDGDVRLLDARGGLSSILATRIGTTRFSFTGNLDASDGEILDAKLSGSVSQSFFKETLKPLSLSFSFSLGAKSSNASLNTGYSFRIGSLGVGVGLSMSYSSASANTVSQSFNARVSLSMSMPLSNGFNVSFSSNLDSSFNAYATVAVSKSFGKRTSTNASYSVGTSRASSLNLGLSHSAGRSNIGLSISGLSFKDLLDHSVGASWTYRGDLASIALREQVSNGYSSFTTSTSIGTSLAFADGHFAMANNISGPFLIVSPETKSKNVGVSMSQALNSNSTELKRTFGNFIYTNLSMYVPNNVFVSVSQGELFSSNASLYRITPFAAQGFVASIPFEALATATGVVTIDGRVLSSYSSSVYKLVNDVSDDGEMDVSHIEAIDTSYVFTDDQGRFVLNELSMGTYLFDLNVQGMRYAVMFNVPEIQDVGLVLVFEDLMIDGDFNFEESSKLLPPSVAGLYDGVAILGNEGFVSEDEFWDIVFGV